MTAWLGAARAAGVEPFVAFNHSRERPTVLPSVPEYTRAVRAFHARWPQVHVFSAWNEINHASQPTAGNPERAAAYYAALRGVCSGCTVTAADVLDQAGMVRYVRRFEAALPGAPPRLWGLHNYSDTNRFRPGARKPRGRARRGVADRDGRPLQLRAGLPARSGAAGPRHALRVSARGDEPPDQAALPLQLDGRPARARASTPGSWARTASRGRRIGSSPPWRSGFVARARGSAAPAGATGRSARRRGSTARRPPRRSPRGRRASGRRPAGSRGAPRTGAASCGSAR